MDLEQALKVLKANPLQDVEQMRSGIKYYANKSDITKNGVDSVRLMKQWNVEHGMNPLHAADNRIPTNWHKIAVDQKVGYMFTNPPLVDVGSSTERVTDVLDTEDYSKVIKQLAIDASNTGRGWLAYWYEGIEKPFAFYFIDPTQITPVYDTQSVKPTLLHLIRRYSVVEGGKTVNKSEVWDAESVAYFTSDKQEGIKPHMYGRIPFIEFRNNQAATSDLDMYKQIIDAIDKVVSGLANDMDDVQEILFIIKNYAGESTETDYIEGEDGEVKAVQRTISPILRAKMRKYFLVDGDGGVDVLKAEIPFEARKAYLGILIDCFYVAAMAVNPNPDKTGNQSGVYIDFLYSLLELKSGMMETEFRAAINELTRAILRYLGVAEDVKITQTWTRNKPLNETEQATIINGTPDTVVSRATKTRTHPLVDDPEKELKQIKKEQEEDRRMFETPPVAE